jgi:hypothetical protein
MLKTYRNGDVTYVQIHQEMPVEGKTRSANVIFVGADYEDFEVKQLYKSLNVIKPDLVMLQVRPDLVVDRFKAYD